MKEIYHKKEVLPLIGRRICDTSIKYGILSSKVQTCCVSAGCNEVPV